MFSTMIKSLLSGILPLQSGACACGAICSEPMVGFERGFDPIPRRTAAAKANGAPWSSSSATPSGSFWAISSMDLGDKQRKKCSAENRRAEDNWSTS
jgi:hypothetical protein